MKQELAGKYLSVAFDGTTRLGEALAVVARIVDDWNIQQRLIRIQLLTQSMCGDELAREIINVLSITYGVHSSNLVAVVRDGASVNGAAMRIVRVVYPELVDVTCFSHMLNRVGEHFATPNLSEFTSAWISLFSHSSKTKLLWKTLTGKAMATYSATRWWSKWEVQKQVLDYFGDVQGFLLQNPDLGSATRAKLLHFFDDIQRKASLQLELAAVVDCGQKFVKACYMLEGDEALALKTYEVINTVAAAIKTDHWPNLNAIARLLSPQNTQQLLDYGKKCVLPGCTYFEQQLSGKFKQQLDIFKAARLFSPHQIQFIKPDVALIQDQLGGLPFVKSVDLTELSLELPTYLARAEGVCNTTCSLKWWKSNSDVLPNWSRLARKIVLLQPSSGCVERVFSLLNSTFGEQQDNSLQDYVQSSIMLQ